MTNKKKLLITASTFPRWEGDTEPRFILDYAKAMTNYFEVHVLVPMAHGAKEEEFLEGVFIHRFHYFPFHRFETLCYPGAIVPRIKEKKIRIILVPFLLFQLGRYLEKYSEHFDFVHAHWLLPQGIMQAFVKDVPYVVTGHGGDVTSMNVWPIIWLKKKALSCSAASIGVSRYICEKMNAINPSTFPTMIPMGVDIDKFSPEKRNINLFSHEKKNIIFVGRLAEKKGVTYLIDAMKMIDANLFIIGDGPLEELLKNQVYESLLEEKVTFWGAKSHEELPEILASADLFVAPSIVARDGDQEGLPVSIVEAMASGIPVVAGRSGGTKEIINEGINGYSVDAKNVALLSDKINEILNDEELAKKMSYEAICTSKDYSYSAIARKHYEIFSKI